MPGLRPQTHSNSVKGRGYAVVRIVVAGDRQTGKSSLIHAAGYKFPNKATPVLPPFCDGVPVQIIDTSSRTKDSDRVDGELQRADVVILTYACDRPETFENIRAVWLPRLRNLEVKVPVIVAGCKFDLQDQNQEVSLEEAMSPLMQQFCEIEAYIECSVLGCFQVFEVFFLAQKAALYPTNPLYDKESKTLKPRCIRALKRVFILCDHDKDGALSDVELNDFQVKCFNAPFQPREISDVKTVANTFLSKGVDERGLTLAGFLCLHTLFVEKGPLETIWTVLRKFGYNNDMKLADDLIPPLKHAPDQSVELTNKAIDFLKTIFDEFDGDSDKVLQPSELEELFSTAPESPWIENPYKDALGRNACGGISVDSFLSEWALMTLLNPTFSMENLVYIGYPGDPSSALRVTRRRHEDRQKQHSERNVLQCFVFGPMQTGKSALLNSSIGRPYIEAVNSTDEDRYAVHVIDISRENKKYLVMREISESGVTKLLANKKSLASCDIAVFVHDRFDESSWKESSELLLKVAGHGERTGFQVPCLIVATKDDQDSLTMAIQEATAVFFIISFICMIIFIIVLCLFLYIIVG
ncbi:mitochondrial Rho GTPase 1-like [Vicia villosa]|uniref:mitochondrial Rho GTPase 1-like n=1 Tax=Vicia villosa TaxID=3911 RepID=UPI00273B8451|nr:mitochondrial Rho GTPase 1-like [Vicia villosa]